MTDMESKALEVIWDWGGEATINTVARELHISLDYGHLICKSLGEHEYIDVVSSGWCKLKGKGKLEAAKRKASKPKKVVVAQTERIPEKKGRLVLGY